jgi:predicted nucleotidyltransferase
MKFGLPDHILHAIIRELHKREKITRAVIFGSRASNDYKYNSDIDLAVYCEGKLPPGLWVDLDEAAGIYKIDVVDMNSNLDEKLRREIEEQGVEVYRRG